MSTVEFAFTSGKVLVLETEAGSVAEFFEKHGPDGHFPGWLVFPDGTAVQTGNVDWLRVVSE